MIGAGVALALLIIGEISPILFPVRIALEVHGGTGLVTMDGGVHNVNVPDIGAGAHIFFEQPGPAQREFQIDGSDATLHKDRDAVQFGSVQGTFWYGLIAWVRDESGYSSWQDIRLIDLSDGHVVATGRDAVQSSELPAAFRLEAALRRPEAPARIWLQARDGSNVAGLSIERDSHRAVWLLNGGDDQSDNWFFPYDAWPYAAELANLVGRAATAAIALLVCMAAVGAAVSSLAALRRQRFGAPSLPPASAIAATVVAVWSTAAVWVTVRVYHQLPHIIDAQSYYFQARIFETGRTWLHAPDVIGLLDAFQQVEWNGRWFSQYPPGAPALYALGDLFGVGWLVGPVFTLGLVIATGLTGFFAFDRKVGLTALTLSALSPFVLFQAGSFMSHPIAGGVLACSLALFIYAWRSDRSLAFIGVGALLGLAFNTREITALLYGGPYTVWLLAHRRWRGLIWIGLALAFFVAVYLAYNVSTTGSALTLPRNLFNPDDHWGFGDLGSVGQHTLAAGLVNTDENLTLLQFDLFGWPPLAALALVGMPFLLGRAGRFDALFGGIVLAFIVAYAGYFYNGIALGPRYYFEAVPALVLLAARGLQIAVQTLREIGLEHMHALAGGLVVVGALCTWTFGYYLPHAIDRRMDYAALPNGKRLVLPFVETTLSGPRLDVWDTPALVLVPNDDAFKTLSALNCPLLEQGHLASCPVLLVRAGLDRAPDLADRFPGRSLWLVDTQGDVSTLDLVARRDDRLETAALCTQSRCSPASPPG